MFLALFVKQSGPILVEAIVIQVMDHSMDCVLSNMGITKRVYVNRNDEIESFDYLKHDGSLTLKQAKHLFGLHHHIGYSLSCLGSQKAWS